MAGKHAWVVDTIEGLTASAQGFDDSSSTLCDIPIVNAVYAYDRRDTGETVLLEFNHCLYLGNRKNDAIACPNQLRLNGVSIDDRPQSLFPNSSDAQRIMADGLTIPLHMHGPLSHFNARRPTFQEMNDENLQTICMTSSHGWDPYGSDSLSFYDPSRLTINTCRVSFFLSTFPLNNIYHVSSSKKGSISVDDLMKRWGIGKHSATLTLQSTLQEYTRSADNLSRRFKTARVHSRFRQLLGPHSTFYTDTLFSNVKSLRGNTCGQVYYNRSHFFKFYPLENKKDAHETIIPLLTCAGMPSHIHSDRAPELIGGQFGSLLRKFRIRHTTSEPHSPWQNRAEGEGVKPIKKLGLWLMQRNGAPTRTWDYAYELAADILSLTCKPSVTFSHQTGYQIITNIRPDISQYATFGFYQWIWHWDELSKQKQLGRWLGVAQSIGPVMTFWILPFTGTPIPRSTVVSLLPHDFDDPVVKARMSLFDTKVTSMLNDTTNYTVTRKSVIKPHQLIDASDPPRLLHEMQVLDSVWDGDINFLPYEPTTEERAMEELDEHIGQHIQLFKDDVPVLVKIVSRKRDATGSLVGKRHDIPQLDGRVYNVRFPDGHYEQYAANTLTEALHSSLDDRGYDTSFIKELCGYRVDPKLAVPDKQGFITSPNGRQVPVITTKGWSLRVRWMDDSVTWVPLGLLKNTEPLLVAEYARSMNIHTKPAFNWWVHHTLRRKSRLISKVKSLYHKNNLKFGVVVPQSIKEALHLDKVNNNSHWRDAIKKEMTNVKIAFRFLDKNGRPPPGYKQIRCHIIFDVKMDLTHKARFVAGGHLTDPPTSMTYASVVSRETVRIAFLLAALNDLEILAGDIGNAYLNATTNEKIYYRAGLEWGDDMQGTICVIVRALYGLKSSANAWRNHICSTLRSMDFTFSLADNDLWMRQDTKPDGTSYYSYILVYVDDILIISHDPERYMNQLKSKYYVKEDSIGPPKLYLGAEFKRVTNRSGGKCWASSCNRYVKEAVGIVFERQSSMNIKLTRFSKSPDNPFSNIKYRPELDLTEFCSPDEHQFYQQMIGIARWMIELGRMDISIEISLLSRYCAAPRLGHLSQLLHVFHYLRSHQSMDLTYDQTKITVTESTTLPHQRASYKASVLKSLYPDACDYLPPNMPKPLGKTVQLNSFVDADLAGEQTTRRSQTGLIIYANMAPIVWLSKRQSTVEASTFGSEFVAMRSLVELLIGLRYKLRMFGVPIDGPCNVFCDNEAVTKSSMNPEATLKRKHISIAFHQSREAVAAGVMLVFYETTKSNHADLFTKILPQVTRSRLMGYICGRFN